MSSLSALLESPVALPSMPRTVALLMTELAVDEINLRRVNHLISMEPALAGKVLEMANSATFRLTGQVAGIPQALALLGAVQLRKLVSSASMGTASRSVPGIHLPQFCRYSLNTAKLARSLAGIVRQDQQAAYTAGLLHAVGELVIHMADADKARSLDSLVTPWDIHRARIEQRIFGYHYGHVSAALARQWQLPESLIEALHHQGSPFEHKTCEPLAGLLHLASWRARTREAGFDEKETTVTFPGEVGVMLGLDIDVVLQQDPIDWNARPEPEDAAYII